MSLSPPVVFPNTVTPQPTSHSKGSFGPVFIVLAIVIVVSAFACCIGQLCARRFSHSKPRKDRQNVHPRDGDIEFGFGKKVPTGKPMHHGQMKQPRPIHGYGDMKEPRLQGYRDMKETRPVPGYGEMKEPRLQGYRDMKEPRPFHYGDTKGDVKFYDDGEARAGA